MPRNLYNDNIKDVYNIEDLESLKEDGYMNVLAYQDDYVMIEAGKDFWKIDTEKGVVTQYKDYVSLQNNIDGELVYSKEYPALNRDYGAVLYDAVENSDYKNLPKFELQNRQDYFENTTKGLVRNKMKGEFEQSIAKNRKETQEISSNLTESLNKPETKFIADSVKIATDIMSIVFTFLKNNVDKNRRERFLKDIVEKLDKNEIDLVDVKFLTKEYPELENILHQWQKGRMRLNLETSTTVDKALENQQNIDTKANELVQQEEQQQLKQAPLQPEQSLIDEKEQNLKTLIDQTDGEMEQLYGVNFKERIQKMFEKSGGKESIDYCSNLLDEKTLEDLKIDNPDLNKDDCIKAIAYVNHLIEDGNNRSEKLLMDKLSDNSLGDVNTPNNMKNFLNIVHRMISRGEELVKTEQRRYQM